MARVNGRNGALNRERLHEGVGPIAIVDSKKYHHLIELILRDINARWRDHRHIGWRSCVVDTHDHGVVARAKRNDLYNPAQQPRNPNLGRGDILQPGGNKITMVDLSGVDSKKWGPLLAHSQQVRFEPETGVLTTESKYRRQRPPHQRQKRPTASEVDEIAKAYQSGSSVYQLSTQFGCHRTTISNHLKSCGVAMRRTSLTEAQVDRAVELYESGLSLVKIGMLIGANAETVRQRLRERGIRLRGPHERPSTGS